MSTLKLDQISRSKLVSVAGLLICFLLYLVGFKIASSLAALICLILWLPLPAIINSWLSRVIVAWFFLYSLLQLAAVGQYYLNSGGGFDFIAVLLTALIIGVVILSGNLQGKDLRIVNARDWCAIAACGFFLIPFVPIFMGDDVYRRIGEIGSIQITDASVHFRIVNEMSNNQNLNYGHHYYPSGFHIASAFLQDSVTGGVESMTWKSNTLLYFAEYIVSGLMLCFMLVYASLSVLGRLLKSRAEVLSQNITLALVVGAGTTILHLLPFMHQGFLNYYYICTALVIGLLFLLDEKLRALHKIRSLNDSLLLVGYLLVTLGVSYSWPIFMPVILLTAFLVLLPNREAWSAITKKSISRSALGLIGLIASAHVVSLIIQMYFSDGSNIDAGGAIHSFNIPLLIIGSLVSGFKLCSSHLNKGYVSRLAAIVMPYMLLMVVLMASQYLRLGEARYYLMKSAFAYEMVLLVFCAAFLVYLLSRTTLSTTHQFLCSGLLIAFVIFATIGLLPRPLQEIRELFRNYSSLGKPPFFDSDVRKVVELGVEGKAADFNITVLHHEAGKMSSHIQTANWVNSMTSDLSTKGRICFGNQLAYLGTQNEELIEEVHSCAEHAAANGREYYVVTDASSAPIVHEIFGDSVKIVY